MEVLGTLGLDDGAALAAFELHQNFDGLLFGHQALGGIASCRTCDRTQQPEDLALALDAAARRATDRAHHTPDHSTDATLAAIHRDAANA